MNEEIELAAKSVGESVGALAEASGVLGPVKELADWVTSFVHYRRQFALAKQVNRAAEKIRAARLPPAAVSDKLLRALLEGGSMEDDESMQERWANLLANAVTGSSVKVRIAFPKILSEIEPAEAALLDKLASETPPDNLFAIHELESFKGLHTGGIGNLVRLRLLDYVRTMPNTWGTITDDGSGIFGVTFTRLGWKFLLACRNPPVSGSDVA
jgi:Abortive infection alpha